MDNKARDLDASTDWSWLTPDLLKWAEIHAERACAMFQGRAGACASEEDVAQEILIRMARAWRRFDASRGVKFSTFYGRHIRHEAQRIARRMNQEAGTRSDAPSAKSAKRSKPGRSRPVGMTVSLDSFTAGRFRSRSGRPRIGDRPGERASDPEDAPSELFIDSRTPPPDEIAEANEEAAILETDGHKTPKILLDLPPNLQKVMMARVVEEKSAKQVAAEIGSTRQNVQQLQERATRLIREKLSPKLDEAKRKLDEAKRKPRKARGGSTRRGRLSACGRPRRSP